MPMMYRLYYRRFDSCLDCVDCSNLRVLKLFEKALVSIGYCEKAVSESPQSIPDNSYCWDECYDTFKTESE